MIAEKKKKHHRLRVWAVNVGEFTHALGKQICKIWFFRKNRCLILKKCETVAKIKKSGQTQ